MHVDVELSGGAAAARGRVERGGGGPDARTRLRALAAKQGVPLQVRPPELLWRIASAERQPAQFPTAEAGQPVVMAALEEALQGFVAMRATGRARRCRPTCWPALAALERQVDAIAARAPLRAGTLPRAAAQAPARGRARARSRRRAGAQGDRAVCRPLRHQRGADAAAQPPRATRPAPAQPTGEIGRKAEFILQEIGRESHTIGSKANDLAIAKAVIEFKNELERVREQIANVE